MIVSKPYWLKITPSSTTDLSKMKGILKKRKLVTVCEEANCPNMAECWHNEGTATFMVLGDTCTRGCKFCAIKTAPKGNPIDENEPENIASAIEEIGLDYAVITSVDRDDLEDNGSNHFAKCIRVIKEKRPNTKVEVLIGDLQGSIEDLKIIINANPEVIAHNIETIKEFQLKVRDPRANYEQSLNVLKNVKKLNPEMITKSSIMVGLGENKDQIIQTMKDLKEVGCDILTLGQYLRPRNKFLKVEEYVHPDIFKEYQKIGEDIGFLYVASGPFVRSSYRASEFFIKGMLKKREVESCHEK